MLLYDNEPFTEQYDYSDYYSLNGTSDAQPCDNDNIKKFGTVLLPVCYSLVFVFGFTGNTLCLLDLIIYNKMKRLTDTCLLNLAISNMLFVFSLPFLAHYAREQWIFGSVMCKVVSMFYLLGYYSGIFFITLMSIEQYLIVLRHKFEFKVKTITFKLTSNAAVWGMAFLASLPQLKFSEEQRDEDILTCRPKYPSDGWKLFLNFETNILGLIIPLIIMVFCYVSIIQYLIKKPNSDSKKAIKRVLAIVLLFFIFWTPYNIVIFMNTLTHLKMLNDCETSKKIFFAMQGTETFAFFHCCLNPFVYAFVGKTFWNHLCAFAKANTCMMPFFKWCKKITAEQVPSFHSQSKTSCETNL
ncbi:C-C chemokine receptor type 4-like [Protopterus annectens]|uniref:C-C chemokine receptor type 4-like n=1 Tax=Protopterus annectens TaxID=7888 RepID=UPI001CFA8252|nr:C-C chemokine receptor type 4-like [Protopterus annectens]